MRIKPEGQDPWEDFTQDLEDLISLAQQGKADQAKKKLRQIVHLDL